MPFAEGIESLASNQYFNAGAGLFGIGIAAAFLKRAAQLGTVLFRRQCMMTLEVTSRDKSYSWLLHWIVRYGTKSQHLSVETTSNQTATGRVTMITDFVPSPGTHFFIYKGYWIKVDRNREKQMMDFQAGLPFETVTLTTLGRKRELFFKILEESRSMALKSQEGKTVMYTAKAGEWRPLGYPKKKRPIDSVILKKGLSEKILMDAREFIASDDWYMNRGIPYRRGYLFYGPPGCGKSSYILALAGELDYNICIMDLSDKTLSDDRLQYLLMVAPEHSIILLEDIDGAYFGRDLSKENAVAYQGMGRLTFSGLLNALDGVASAEGRIVCMTTNYVDRLDPALIRPGRVDVQQHIDYCSRYQLSQMFTRFYPTEPGVKAERFASRVMEQGARVSSAQVQGLFMMHKADPDFVFGDLPRLTDAAPDPGSPTCKDASEKR